VPPDHPSLDANALVGRYTRHVNPAFVKLLGVFGYGRVYARAQDVWVWDAGGRRYLDLLAGFGSINLGHNHVRLVARLREFLNEDAVQFCHVGPSPHAADLAAHLASCLPQPLEVVLLSNSGAEAVEAALKLARAATSRHGFIYCDGAYHGTSLGTLSVMGAQRLRRPFEPLLADCVAIPFGDLPRLETALAPRQAAAFIVEPVLCEGGVVLPPQGYLQAARELCKRHGALFILDEVQTGLGRTGTMFACQAENVVPDIIVLAKALSGGIAPIGATVTSAEIHARAYGSMDRFDLHSTTFGGNAFACTAALETLRIIADTGLVANSAARGEQLLPGLRARLAGHPLVRDIRGRGLLVGIELGPTEAGWLNRLAPSLVSLVSEKVFGQWLALKLLEKGFICQPAAHHGNVLKLEPPLTIAGAQIDEAVNAVAEVLGEYQSLGPILTDVTGRLQSQFRTGWAFR